MKIDTTHAECRQWIKENLEDLTFDEKKKVLRRTDKETLFGFNSHSALDDLKRIPPKHQKILSDTDRGILLMRFMTLNVVKNDFLEAKGHWYYGLHYENPRSDAILYTMGNGGMNKKLAQYLSTFK